MTDNYKLFPDLSPAQYAALKRDIGENGVRTPGITDQDGNLLEGFQRDRICRELKTSFPKVVRTFLSEEEKLAFVLAANCQRRQLSRKQKSELIAAYLVRDPEIADNNLADLIGCSHNTVRHIRRHLERTRQIDELTKFRGKDGRRRRAKQVFVNTAKELDKAIRVINDLPDACDGKIIDFTTAQRRARRSKKSKAIRAEGNIAVPLPADLIQLHYCRFQELEKVAGIEPGSVHLINTDIPYGKMFLDELPDLAAFASRVLVDGGLLVMLCGQYWLNRVIEILDQHLTYRWVIANGWDSLAVPVYFRGGQSQVTSKWKPILVYSKGNITLPRSFTDVIWSNQREKNFHDWQQPYQEVETLVHYFSNPGDLVVDPCGGSFTTAASCQKLGRRCVSCDCEEWCVAMGQKRLANVSLDYDVLINQPTGAEPMTQHPITGVALSA